MKIFFRTGQARQTHRQRRRLPFLIGSFVLVTSLLLAILNFAVFSSAQDAHAATWTQIWGDEFNGTSGTAPSSSNWLYDLGTSYPGGAGNWGTGEVESETNSTANVYQDGSGHLAIKPIRAANGSWTSGRIETQNSSFAAPAGGQMAIEASIQMPNVTGAAAQGYWPAFWALGAAFRGNYTNWPIVGEIDTMENVNGTNMEYGTLHCGVSPGGPCNETSGRGGSTPCTGSTCQAGFHTYRVEVDRSTSPEQVRWYLDGVEFWHVSSNDAGMDATTWNNAIHHGFFIILNVAIGGGWPGNPTASTASGVPMLINYVHVLTAGGTTGGSTPTVAPPTPTPTAVSGCPTGSFTSGVVNASASTALPWFKACGWTAGYVIIHYTVSGGGQQNIYMTYNSGTARWEYTVGGITAGHVLQYSFTYQKSGLQYDTGTTSWTHP